MAAPELFCVFVVRVAEKRPPHAARRLDRFGLCMKADVAREFDALRALSLGGLHGDLAQPREASAGDGVGQREARSADLVEREEVVGNAGHDRGGAIELPSGVHHRRAGAGRAFVGDQEGRHRLRAWVSQTDGGTEIAARSTASGL
jgi:hypothetical protein